MKRYLLYALFVIVTASAHAQFKMPQPSPTQTITQNFGLGKIELVYSRPSLKGRTVFQQGSDLAPLGQIWRTGANEATRLTFTDAVIINGKQLDTGRYVLYTIPGATEWTVVLNKGIENWGTDGYKEQDDVVRMKVPATTLNENIETFTIQFDELKPESCVLYMMWGKTVVAFPIETRIKDRLRKEVETALASDKKPYWDAANFYYQLDSNYNKAYDNIQMAVKENADAYYMFLLKARIEKQLGKKAEAKASAEKCKQLAEGKNPEYVKMAGELIAGL